MCHHIQGKDDNVSSKKYVKHTALQERLVSQVTKFLQQLVQVIKKYILSKHTEFAKYYWDFTQSNALQSELFKNSSVDLCNIVSLYLGIAGSLLSILSFVVAVEVFHGFAHSKHCTTNVTYFQSTYLESQNLNTAMRLCCVSVTDTFYVCSLCFYLSFITSVRISRHEFK